ncbi:ABC transporter permease, partial [Streptomyces sp. 7G]|uniref:ABC transporter permease n=1 Tax=Streptomyces sp. 7G TaxID=2877241 RepID=UPI001CD3D5B0
MRSYLLRRLPSALLVLFAASFLIFAILRLVPGDPATSLAGPDASPATVAAIRDRLGLDAPLLSQYAHWIGSLLTGDLGPSYAIGGEVSDLIGDGLGATTELTLAALLFVIVIGTAFGILGATSRSRWIRSAIRITTTAALAVPPFVSGVLLVVLFAVVLGVLPPGGRVAFLDAPDLAAQYLLLPALCLALPSAAVLGRYLKDGIERALAEDYIRTATAAGVAPRRLLWRPALPGALPPVVTLLGMPTGHLL